MIQISAPAAEEFDVFLQWLRTRCLVFRLPGLDSNLFIKLMKPSYLNTLGLLVFLTRLRRSISELIYQLGCQNKNPTFNDTSSREKCLMEFSLNYFTDPFPTWFFLNQYSMCTIYSLIRWLLFRIWYRPNWVMMHYLELDGYCLGKLNHLLLLTYTLNIHIFIYIYSKSPCVKVCQLQTWQRLMTLLVPVNEPHCVFSRRPRGKELASCLLPVVSIRFLDEADWFHFLETGGSVGNVVLSQCDTESVRFLSVFFLFNCMEEVKPWLSALARRFISELKSVI